MHSGNPGAWYEVAIVGTTCWNSVKMSLERGGYEEIYMNLQELAQLSSVS